MGLRSCWRSWTSRSGLVVDLMAGHLDVQLGPVPGPGGVNRLLKPVFPPSGGGRISGLYATYYIRLFNSCWDAEGSIAN